MATVLAASQIAATAGDIMHQQVVSVRPEMTIRTLVQRLSDQGVSGAPVVTPTGRIVGVVSATDVMRFVAHEAEIPAGQLSWEPRVLREEENRADEELASYFYAPEVAGRLSVSEAAGGVESGLDAYTVADIMTPVAFSVRPAEPITELVELFLRGRIHRVLVVEKELLLGIVTPFDVLRWMVGSDEAQPQEPGP